MASYICWAKNSAGWIAARIPFVLGFVTLALPALPLTAQSDKATFSFPERGGVSLTTLGASSAVRVGHARISNTGSAVPAGFAIFGLRQNNTLVSEATVPAANLVSEGRIYAEIGGGVNTGIAISNENNQPVQIAYYFTDSTGARFGSNVITIPAKGQIAKFLSEAPFNVSALLGTFTFFILRSAPDQTVGAIALRGFTNERGEFLMTTLPVTPLGQRGLYSGNMIPHFASGGGWTTQIVLLNPTDTELDGQVSFIDQSGLPDVIGSESGSNSSFSYRVAPRSSWRLRTSNTGALHVGSVRLSSSVDGADIPIGFLIFSFQTAGVRVSESGVPPVRPAAVSRMFVEASGQFNSGQPGSLQTGIAISNADSTIPVHVSLDLTTLDGTPRGLTGSLDIPAGGQTAKFLTQIPGFESLPTQFQGVLRISSPGSPVSVIGIRGRYNERGDFLDATIPAMNENDDYFAFSLRYSDFVFPDFADGAGYTTQFVLFSGWTAGSAAGTLQFLTNAGDAFPLTLQVR